MSTLSERIEQWASGFGLPDECPVDEAEIGAWLIRPPQHLAEFVCVVSVFSLILWISMRRFRQRLAREQAARPKALDAPRPVSAWIGVVDRVCTLLLSASLLTVVWHKYNGAKLAYLLQPCHVLHALLLLILQMPRGSTAGAVLLAVYLHSLTGPLLGTVGVDLSCYTQPLEALNWGVQHISLLLVPLHLLASRRFGGQSHGGLAIYAASFSGMVLFHFGVLTPISILTGTNLNYMLCPPQGVGPMVALGRYYRLPTIAFCAFTAFVMRYILVSAFVARCVRSDDDQETTAAVAPLDMDAPAKKLDGAAPRREGLRQRA